MSCLVLSSQEEAADKADEKWETQSMLNASSTPAPPISKRCWMLQGAVVMSALLLIAGVMALTNHGGSGSRSSPRVLVVDQDVPASYVLNRTGAGCTNTPVIRFLSRAVSSEDECGKLCRSLVNCVQFNYNPDPSEPGEVNCALFKDWCVPGPSEWELYDDPGGKVSNDAAVIGFDTNWSVDGNDAWSIFDAGSGCPRDSFKCPAAGTNDLVAAGPPPRQSWEAAFDHAVTARRQPGDHCCEEASGPRLFASARLSVAGLGSRLNNFANEVLWAMWAGMPLALCTPDGVHDSWPRYFEPVEFARCSDCGGAKRIIFESATCAGADASRSLDTHTLGDIKRFLYSKIFKFNPDTLKQRDSVLKSLSLEGGPYIGVHIRRGDKIKETHENYVGVQVFADVIRKHCSSFKGTDCKVYVASDWPNAREKLQEQLPEMTVVAQDRLASKLYKVRNLETEAESSKGEAETSFVLDLSILAHSEVFIGTASSNVGRFIYFMRPPNQSSISLDSGGSFYAQNC